MQEAEFIAHIDALADLLIPPRRHQDADSPECSATELRLLATLGSNEPLTMTDLAASLGIHVSTATRAIDKLEAKGLVERKRTAADRRIVQVGFSRKGRLINRFVVKHRSNVARRLLAMLGANDRDTFIVHLAKLANGSGPTSSSRRRRP